MNENANGLIRQYFNKVSSFENIADVLVENVMNKLNHRPRNTKLQNPSCGIFGRKNREAAGLLELHIRVESAPSLSGSESF